jgi:hypothetical protein
MKTFLWTLAVWCGVVAVGVLVQACPHQAPRSSWPLLIGGVS